MVERCLQQTPTNTKVSVIKISVIKVSVTKIYVIKIFVIQISVTKISVIKIYVTKISVTKIYAIKISVTKISVIKIFIPVISWPTELHPYSKAAANGVLCVTCYNVTKTSGLYNSDRVRRICYLNTRTMEHIGSLLTIRSYIK